jgi:cytochrome P450
MQTVQPAGPRGVPVLGNLPDFAKDVLGFLERSSAQYGDITRMQLGNRRAYLLNNPELVHEVLVKDPRNYTKHSFFFRHVTRIFGHGLLTNEGDSWLRQRRLAAPAFHRDRIAGYADTMVAYTDRMVDAWTDGELRNAHVDMMAVTLEIVAKVLFDADVASDVTEVGAVFDDVTEEIAARFRRPIFIPDWVPLPGNRRYVNGVAALDRLVYRIIREHHDRGDTGSDLLSMLMQARDEDGGCMTDVQLRDESVTFLLAGHETTALTLSWAWHMLASNPAVERALHNELDSVLAGRAPRLADMPRLRYTEHVIMESMRLFPPAYVIGRESIRDTNIAGVPIPAGTTIFISPWLLHRDARWFDDPLEFQPDRWADGLADRLPRHVYMPFGGGPRVCIGNSFAMMESVLLLATIARRYRLEAIPGSNVEIFPTITLRPRNGVPVRVMQRTAH